MDGASEDARAAASVSLCHGRWRIWKTRAVRIEQACGHEARGSEKRNSGPLLVEKNRELGGSGEHGNPQGHAQTFPPKKKLFLARNDWHDWHEAEIVLSASLLCD